MDRPQVAAHYRAKGYRVHESMVIEGPSGSHRIPMLCEGPLGNLTVFFGDAGGIDGPEIGAAKRIARDLGATAVVAAAQFTGAQREAAAELGVVLLDDAALATPAAAPPASSAAAWPAAATPRDALERDLAAHPWPDSGRPGGLDGPSRNVTYEIDEVLARFAKPAAVPAPAPAAPAAASAPSATAPPRPATRAPAAPAGLWKHPRPGTVASPAAEPRTTDSPTASPAAATPPAPLAGSGSTAARFAWLNLPKTPEAAPDAEYEGTLAARRPSVAQTAQAQAAPRFVDPQAALRRRKRLRMAAWVGAAAVLAYLFLLWWF